MAPGHVDTGAGELAAGATLRVIEIYRSIQGESTFAGRPCVFVRLAGCPLRCTYCDSTFAFRGGETRPVEDVVAEVIRFGTPLVEVTGGEPLLQEGTYALLRALCDAGREVLLETSGSIDTSRVDPRAVTILDVKCPSSGEAERNDWGNIGRLRPRDEVKFVVADRDDLDWARGVVRRHPELHERTILVAPVFGVLDPATLAAWILEEPGPLRLQIQQQKYIWPPDARGV